VRNVWKLLPALVVLLVALFVVPKKSPAIPAFSRLYGTSCMTCHIDFPKLNDFGKAFKDAGFKFPQTMRTRSRLPPSCWARRHKNRISPTRFGPDPFPGCRRSVCASIHTFKSQVPTAINSTSLLPRGNCRSSYPERISRVVISASSRLEISGSDIAFWVDDDISVSGSNSAGSLGDAYLKFVNVGRFLKLPKDSFTVRIGQFELDLPVTQRAATT
jgi:hypothetical protein